MKAYWKVREGAKAYLSVREGGKTYWSVRDAAKPHCDRESELTKLRNRKSEEMKTYIP